MRETRAANKRQQQQIQQKEPEKEKKDQKQSSQPTLNKFFMNQNKKEKEPQPEQITNIDQEQEQEQSIQNKQQRISPNDDPEMQHHFSKQDNLVELEVHTNSTENNNKNQQKRKKLKKLSDDNYEAKPQKPQKTINEILSQKKENQENSQPQQKKARGRPPKQDKNEQKKDPKKKNPPKKQSQQQNQKSLSSFFNNNNKNSQNNTQNSQNQQGQSDQQQLQVQKQQSQISQVSKQNQQINQSNFLTNKKIAYDQIIDDIKPLKSFKEKIIGCCREFIEVKDDNCYEKDILKNISHFIDYSLFQLLFSQKQVAWTDLYKPKNSRQLISKQNSQYIKLWMRQFYRKLKQKQQAENQSSNFGYLDDDSNYRSMSMYSNSMNTQMKNLQISDVTTSWDYQALLIIGPTSVGKSTFIKCAANDLNMSVKEISNSSKRSSAEIKKQVESTQSIKLTVNQNFFNIKKPQKLQSLSSSQQTLKYSSAAAEEEEEINLNTKEQSKKVTFIKDYDLELDNGFQKELQALAKNTKIPLILTSNIQNFDKLDKKDFDILEIQENYIDSSIIAFIVTEIELNFRKTCKDKIDLSDLITSIEKEEKEAVKIPEENENNSQKSETGTVETQPAKSSSLEEKIISMPQIQELSQNLEKMEINFLSNLEDFEEISFIFKGNLEKILNNFQINYQDIPTKGWSQVKQYIISLQNIQNYKQFDNPWNFNTIIKQKRNKKVQLYENYQLNIPNNTEENDLQNLQSITEQLEFHQYQDISQKQAKVQQQYFLERLLKSINIRKKKVIKEKEKQQQQQAPSEKEKKTKSSDSQNGTLFSNPLQQNRDKRFNYNEEDQTNLHLESTNFQYTQFNFELQNIQQKLFKTSSSDDKNNNNNDDDDDDDDDQNVNSCESLQKMELESEKQENNFNILQNQGYDLQLFLSRKPFRQFIMSYLFPELKTLPKENRIFYEQFETIMNYAYVPGEIYQQMEERVTRRMLVKIVEDMDNTDPSSKFKKSIIGNKLKKQYIEKLYWLLNNNYLKKFFEIDIKQPQKEGQQQQAQQTVQNPECCEQQEQQTDDLIEEAEFDSEFLHRQNNKKEKKQSIEQMHSQQESN